MRKTTLLCWVVIFTVVLLGGGLDVFHVKYVAVAQAESTQQADVLAKEIDKELRSAERNMFNGKNEAADKQLEEISAKLDALKELDSEHKKIKTLESKYARTKKTIDKKLGRTTKVASKEIRGLAKKSEVKESSGEIRGLAEKSEVKESSGEIRGLAKKPEVKEMPAAEPQKRMSGVDRKRALLAERAKKEAGDPAVQADIDKIIELHDTHASKFDDIHGDNIASWTTGYGIEESKKALARINQAESDFDSISSDVGRLAEKYAQSGDMYSSMNIYNSIKQQLGANPQGSPGNKLVALLLAGAHISESRTATGDHLAYTANQSINSWADQMTDDQLKRLQKAKELLVVAVQIDPNNEKAKNLLGKMDDKIAQFADKMKATIDSNVWQGYVSGFTGPGDRETLTASAKKYFENDRDWGGRKKNKITIIAVAVKGPWLVAERDVFSRVIRWRLPVDVAVTDENLKPRNIARVYDLSIVALQGSSDNAPKEPPWDGFWVGDSYMMRLDKF